MSSVFQGILIMLIIGGIYFELQAPGIGFPLIVSIASAILYFAPLYIEGLAANWEIIIFFIGIVLLVIELLVIPGFGIAGIAGIFLIIAGLILSMLNNVDFDFKPVEKGGIGKALFTVMAGISAGFALIIYFSSRIGKQGMFRKVALNTNLEVSEGYIGVPMDNKSLVGKKGIAYTDLRLSGKIQIDDEIIDAVSENIFISKGTPVEVVRFELGQVYVSVLK
jgi:membrane-bound serine protease (ClpP class)